jgi:hypothetical protein
MTEVWLRPNRRALYAGMLLPAVAALGGIALALAAGSPWLRALGGGFLALGGSIVGLLAWQSRQPRVGFVPGYLLFYLRLGSPIRVPIEVVEGCFLGSGPLKLTDASESSLRTANLVFRIADKATDWVAVPIKPALGCWAEGYITIHGAWCERLTLEVVQRLNVRLHKAQQAAAAVADA